MKKYEGIDRSLGRQPEVPFSLPQSRPQGISVTPFRDYALAC